MRPERACALAMSLALACATCGGERRVLSERWELEKASGGISMEPHPSLWMLVRLTGKERRIVAYNVERHQAYPPDCVVFQSATMQHNIFVACGDRTPAPVTTAGALSWDFDPDGLRRVETIFVENGKALQPSKFIPWERIKAHADTQPPYDVGWSKSYVFDHFNPPVAEDVTYIPAGTGRVADPGAGGALHEAARHAYVAGVAALINDGHDVNARMESGATPLMIAVGTRSDSLVAILLAAKAEVNIQDRYGRTALHYAAGNGNVEAVRRLVAAGANGKIRDGDGKTARDGIGASPNAEMHRLLRESERR